MGLGPVCSTKIKVIDGADALSRPDTLEKDRISNIFMTVSVWAAKRKCMVT